MRRTERSRAGAGTGFEVMGFRGRGAAGLPRPEGEVETAKAVRVRSYGLTGGALPSCCPPLLAETSGQWRRMRHIVYRLSTLAAGVMKAVRAPATRLRAMGTAGSGPAMKRPSPFCRLSTRIGGHDEGGPARGGAARCDGDGADRARLGGARALVSRVCRLSTSSPGLMRRAMLKVSSQRRGASRAGRTPATRARGSPSPAAAPCSARRRGPCQGPGASR